MKRFIIIPLLFSLCLNGDEIKLTNDSDYDLSATIRDANGQIVGKIDIPAHTADVWTSAGELWNLPQSPSDEMPPPPPNDHYLVTWYCRGGEEFSSCDEVYNQSTINANGCPGNQQCGMGLSSPQ